MRVVFGRAPSGARSALRALICGIFATGGLLASGCGDDTIVYGTAVATVSVTPGPFSSYLVNLDTVTLTRTDGAVVYLLAALEQVDFTRLSDLTELMGTPAVPEGTYTSATITVDYSTAAISLDVDGVVKLAAVVDDTGAAVTTIGYTLTFDPAHPLVVTRYKSTPVDLNFDLNASTTIETSTSTPTVVVKPMLTLSTAPLYRNTIRSRGSFVTADTSAGNFVMNTHPFFDVTSNAFGAVTVQATAQTAYNVNGVNYTGAAGLAAIAALPISTSVAALGSLGSLANNIPVFNATQIYAGTSLDSFVADRISGTVKSRSGDTLTIQGAEIFNRGGIISFLPDFPVTIGSNTIVSIDGRPTATGVTPQSISVGQRVDIGGVANLDVNGNYVSFDATAGLVRLSPTHVWGTLNSGATPGTAPVKVVTLGEFVPAAFTFTGTGSTAAHNSNPNAYVIDTGSLDESGTAVDTLLRADGLVNSFGSAPPDFNATAVTPGTSTDQQLVVIWAGTGAKAPFTAASSSGLALSLGAPNTAEVLTGPSVLDLTKPSTAVLVEPDPALTSQLALGNATNGIQVFNSFASYLTAIGTLLNGTNTVHAFVAVGHYDPASATFKAYRMDLLQQ